MTELLAWPDTCTCGHLRAAHSKAETMCFGHDSYGQPCTCFGFERDASMDPEDDQ